ncbi:MAG: protein kinase [Polyangiaceae bacterium]|nr:protein kinase [Polyangiaceae bacterium]
MRSPLADSQFQALYEVVGPLGRGGMGEVVRIRHRVWEIDLAAKVPLPATVASAGGLPHLRREAETWIRLPNHPHVVTCHYVRTFADTPVIFTEFVEGGSLADAIERGSFKGGAKTEALVTQALSIALDVAHGLAHAHAAGVVHQDVKPSNVLLDEHGAKLTDFGIAAIGKNEIDTAKLPAIRGNGTMVATVVGMTPLYASPEQLATLQSSKRRKREPITRATDIWSLGLTLLETLIGRAPWQPGSAEAVLDKADGPWIDAVDLLRRMLAEKPSARPKAVEVAAELAALLERRGVARKPPMGAEMRADALNNRAVSLLDLDSREEARQLLREALAIDPCHPEAVFNDALLAWRAGETTDRGALDRVRQAVSASTDWQAKLLEAWIQIERGDEKGAWLVLDRVAEHARGAVRGTRAVARASRAVRDAVREVGSFRACGLTADALALSHDERRVVVGARDGSIGIFDLSSGRCEHRIRAHAEYVFGVAITRDGRRVYSTGWDGVFAAHDVETGRRVFQKKQPGKLSTLVLSADEKRAWTGSLSGTFRAWSIGKRSAKMVGDWLSLADDNSIMCAALTPNGKTLLVGGEDDVLHYIDANSGETLRSLKLSSRPYSLAFVPGGDRATFLVGRGDQQVTLHDLETGEQLGALRDLQSWVSVVAVSKDGKWAVCNEGLHWSLWDLAARRCMRTVEAPAMLTEAVFLSNGELVTLDWSGMVRRYVIEAPAPAPTMVALPRRSRELAAGRQAVDAALAESAAALDEGRIDAALAAAKRARDAQGFERAPDVLAHWERIAQRAKRIGVRAVWPVDRWGKVDASSGFALDPSRRFLAAPDEKGNVIVWKLDSQGTPERAREIAFPEDELSSRALAFSMDGGLLAIGTYMHLHVVDLAGGPMRTSTVPRGYVSDVAFGGPQGSLVAALDDHGHAHVFRANDLERIATVRGPENWTNALAFAGDDRLLTGDYDGHLIAWDIAKAAESGFLPGEWNSDDNRKPEPAQAFIRDFTGFAIAGSRSISAIRVRNGHIHYGCADNALHVLELASGKHVLSLEGHGASVSCFDFLDEHHVVTGSFDKTVRIFDLRNGACLTVVEGHTHTIWDVAVLGPGRFVTASDDEQIRRFHVDWELAEKDAQTA